LKQTSQFSFHSICICLPKLYRKGKRNTYS